MLRNQTRRHFLSLLPSPLLAAPPPRPNIVLILFDDLGWRDFATTGHPTHQTPNIDALAREGVRFTQAYAACPVCSPSRAALLTGRYPTPSGVTDWIPGRPQWPSARLLTPRTATSLPLSEITLAEALSPLGYRTASIGKWHLGGSPGFLPGDQGFPLNIGGDHRGANKFFGPFAMPGLEGRNSSHYLTTELGQAAVSFATRSPEPFFLYAPNYAVHLPLEAPGITGPKGAYAEMLRIADSQIGLLREALKRSGQYDNTAWIITSDNGGLRYEGKSPDPVTDNAPLRAGKGHLYEGGIRVPLIIKAPGWTQPAQLRSQRVSGIDVFPTLLDYLGLPPSNTLDGLSLKPLLTAPPRQFPQRPLFWHYPHYSNQGGVPAGAIIENNWKLIEFYEDSRLELFDLSSDPSEQHNVATRHPRRAQSLLAKLKQWRQSTGAIMPKLNPDFQPTTAPQGLTGAEPPTP